MLYLGVCTKPRMYVHMYVCAWATKALQTTFDLLYSTLAINVQLYSTLVIKSLKKF